MPGHRFCTAAGKSTRFVHKESLQAAPEARQRFGESGTVLALQEISDKRPPLENAKHICISITATTCGKEQNICNRFRRDIAGVTHQCKRCSSSANQVDQPPHSTIIIFKCSMLRLTLQQRRCQSQREQQAGRHSRIELPLRCH